MALRAAQLTIVTGANQGIGFEIAKQLYAGQKNNGPRQIVMACRSVERGTAAADKIVKEVSGGDAAVKPIVLQVDLSDPKTFTTFATEVQKLEASGGQVDSLINNAAILDNKVEINEMAEVLRINYSNTVLFVQTMQPLMKKAEAAAAASGTISSRVVVLSSRLGALSTIPNPSFTTALSKAEGLLGNEGLLDEQMNAFLQAQNTREGRQLWNNGFAPAYCVSKALVNGWFRKQALKAAKGGEDNAAASPPGVGWYTSCPGWVQTNMTQYNPNASTPVDKAADTPVWLATLADASKGEIQSGSFYADRKQLDYVSGSFTK